METIKLTQKDFENKLQLGEFKENPPINYDFSEVSFNGLNILGIDFSKSPTATIEKIFSAGDFRGVTPPDNSDLTGISFKKKNIVCMNLSNCVGLTWTQIRECADMRGVKLPALDLPKTLSETSRYFEGVDFSKCKMSAEFANELCMCDRTILPDVDFSGIDLISRNLILKGANLSNCKGISFYQIEYVYDFCYVLKNIDKYPEDLKDLTNISFLDFEFENEVGTNTITEFTDVDFSKFKGYSIKHFKEGKMFANCKFPPMDCSSLTEKDFKDKNICGGDFSNCTGLTWDELKHIRRWDMGRLIIPELDFSNIMLKGENISYIDFSKTKNLTWENILSSSDFSGITIPEGMDFTDKSFEGISVNHVNFSKAKNLTWKQISGADNFKGVILPDGLDMTGVALEYVEGIDFSKCINLTGKQVVEAGMLENMLQKPQLFPESAYDMTDVKFSEYMLTEPWHCNMSMCKNINPHELVKMKNLYGLTIPAIDFSGVSFKDVSIKWMDLRHCKLTPQQVLESDDFTYAQLPEMDFTDIEFGERDISGVDFRLVHGFKYRKQLNKTFCATLHPFDEEGDYPAKPQMPLFNLEEFVRWENVKDKGINTTRASGMYVAKSFKGMIRLLKPKK